MAAWPSELYNCILRSTLKEKAANNLLRTNMDVGPAKVRRRTTANVRPFSFALKCTSNQVDILLAFFNNDIFGGADEFDFVHPRTGASLRVRWAGDPPEYQDEDGILYDIPIMLEIMP